MNGISLFISSVSFTETLSYTPLTPKDIDTAKEFLSNFIFVPMSEIISEKAAYLRRIHRIGLPDAVIAATAWAYNIPIVTRDKQFQKIKEVTVIVP